MEDLQVQAEVEAEVALEAEAPQAQDQVALVVAVPLSPFREMLTRAARSTMARHI
jgi:hypothetical protein